MPYRKHIYLLVLDGFEELGASLALAELIGTGEFDIFTAGLGPGCVTSAAGLRIVPDLASEDIALARAALFLLPGGAPWIAPERNDPFDPLTHAVTEMLQDFAAAGVPVAASGTACAALARAGLLDGVSHAGVTVEFLPRTVRGFAPSPFHVEAAAISDENVVTASANAPVEFTHEIFRQLGLLEETGQRRWLTEQMNAACRHAWAA